MAVGLGTLTLNLIAQTGLFTQGLNRAEQQTRTSARNMSNELNLVGKSFKDLQGTLMASFAGALSIGAAISKMDAYTGLQNRLKLVTASQTELNNALKDTFNIAQATGQSWDSTAQVYQRFADNAKRLGITLGQTASLTETVAKAISISGGSAASAEAALVQFGQALASGVLRGEEFNSISEQAPGLLKAIATGLNVNIGELRAMAAEGKLTADVVIKSLEKAKVSVDDLFNKTDFTIGNSFTMLNNALIQFVGEAGKANGAASFLSSTIKSLADNLGTIANVAVLGGVALLTKAIATQAIAVKEAIGASIARRAAQAAEAESVVRLATIETQRIRAQVGALASEQNLIVARLRSNVTLQERIVLEARATQVAIQLAVAERNLTAATVAQAAAQNALNTSRTIGARVFAALGGGVGVLTIAVTALAAGYMYMKHRAEEANKKLEEQMQIASKTREELLALKGVQKDVAVNELKDAFEKQNVSLRKLNNEYLGFIDNIAKSGKQSKDVNEIFELARKGAITNTEALERLNKLNILTPEQKKQGLDLVNNYILQAQETLKAEKALNVFKVTVKLAGNEAENAAIQQQKQADALNNTATAADNAKKALSKLAEDKTDAQYILMTAKNLGGDIEKAKGLLAFRKNLGMGSTGGQLDPKKRAAFEASWAAQQQLKAYEESQRNLAKASSKAEKNQESVRQKASDNAIRLAETQSNMQKALIYDFSSASQKMYIDYVQQISDIQEANFNPSDRGQFLAAAKARYDDEILLYKMQQAYELSEHKLTDEAKAHATYLIDQQIINNRSDLNKDEKSKYLASLDEKYAYQKRLLNLESNQRLNDASQAFQTDMQNMAAKYEFERQQILLNKSIGDDERKARINASHITENKEFFSSRDSAWDSYQNAIGVDTSLEQAASQRAEAIQAAYEWELITQEEYQRKMLASESQYYRAKAMLGLDSATETLGTMTSLFGSLFGEQSKAYAAMFALEKGFAVAKAMMAIPESYSKAYNAVVGIPYVGPYLAPVMGGAAAAAQVAQAAMIKNVNLTGMAHDGIDNIPKEGTWLLDGGERVLNPEQNKDLTRYLNDRQAANTQNQPMESPQVNVRVMNSWDDSEYYNALAAPQGEKIVMNIIKRNKTKLGI
ncbi:hypothetical protein EJP75_08340 [Acinetobacter baumannii]|nr:hypothetical protein EJP75_08340 [Acinetobacter baumannii]